MDKNALLLTSTDDGEAAIVSTVNDRYLTLRKHATAYSVTVGTQSAASQRRFEHWRHAALAFAMLYHTERCLARLEGHV